MVPVLVLCPPPCPLLCACSSVAALRSGQLPWLYLGHMVVQYDANLPHQDKVDNPYNAALVGKMNLQAKWFTLAADLEGAAAGQGVGLGGGSLCSA